MNNTVEILTSVYFLIGAVLGTIGPTAKAISKEVESARGTPLTHAAFGTKPPSELKLALLRLILTVGFVLLWPVFTYSIVKEQRRDAQLQRELDEINAGGLWFQYNMGGCGTVTCHDCKYSESVTSFIHGINSSRTGFQCQACGKLEGIESGGPGRANEYARSLICECGGAFERDKVVFCPTCKSKNMTYHMEFIT
jgi:hypothetical protein